MPIGWIDFSESERSKILNILDRLSEQGTLDELGIAPIRDGFANIFFPGTSTIQTRAKYFFIIPYLFRDLENGKENNPIIMNRILSEREKECGKKLTEKHSDESGIIGKVSLANNRWVKRPPSDIYWAGLRRYGIFRDGNMSIKSYIDYMCILKNDKSTQRQLGNRYSSDEDSETDDEYAGDIRGHSFWKIPTYNKQWFDNLSIDLLPHEGQFLKHQIIDYCSESMFAFILKNNRSDVLEYVGFKDLKNIIGVFPEQIQNDFELAVKAADFIYIIQVIYNIIVSDGMNEFANSELKKHRLRLSQIADIDIDFIFNRLAIFNNSGLKIFLTDVQKKMCADDIEGLKKCIINREIGLKGQNRAKTCHPGQFGEKWVGVRELDYRFKNAKIIMQDIFKSEVTNNAESQK